MNENISQVVAGGDLPSLIQSDKFAGFIYAMDYDEVQIYTNDYWKAKVGGIPLNCFLIASTFAPNSYSDTPSSEREVILLRVTDTAQLPRENELLETRLDRLSSEMSELENPPNDVNFDYYTQNEMQAGGLKCRILGTFYMSESPSGNESDNAGVLNFGTDIENFDRSTLLRAYKPTDSSLSSIVNYLTPNARQQQMAMASENGIDLSGVKPIKVGALRYTSVNRSRITSQNTGVPVTVSPADFIGKRTALFGMSRTGKSNTVNILAKMFKELADRTSENIGQLIFDINGEYAYPNVQNSGALSQVFPDDTIIYTQTGSSNSQFDIRSFSTNFYTQIASGFDIIVDKLTNVTSQDLNSFLTGSFDEPESEDSRTAFRLQNKWQNRVAAYQCLLFKADFDSPPNFLVSINANEAVRDSVNLVRTTNSLSPFSEPNQRSIIQLSLADATEWFTIVRSLNQNGTLPSSSSSNNPWVDAQLEPILNLLTQQNTNGSFINGFRVLDQFRRYHTPSRIEDVYEEIYGELKSGKIIIIDISVGNRQLLDEFAEALAFSIFTTSMEYFEEGRPPPNISVYVEEAHNLIGKNKGLTDPWVRMAKEGGKFRIGFVYSTQEVTTIHPSIKANTENWFVTHLNNRDEVRDLSKVYDFGDFEKSILRAQDVGFSRVKTLSKQYVVPVQIDLFAPGSETEEW